MKSVTGDHSVTRFKERNLSIAYVIGRFQPFHDGHLRMIRTALDTADTVVVIIGDTGCAPTYRDPWTVTERIQMVNASLDSYLDRGRVHFVSVEDVPYDNFAWKMKVKSAVAHFNAEGQRRFLVGHKKDESSFYLDLFPEWIFVPTEPFESLDATSIRHSFFSDPSFLFRVPLGTQNFLSKWRTVEHERWKAIALERRAVLDYEAMWRCPATEKYGGPVIAAVDTLLHTEHLVLLIRRGNGVGRGTLALPGGFVEPKERLLDAAIRELHEETGIALDKRDINSPLVVFDHPGRSMRGRIITNVLCVKVPNEWHGRGTASDDAAGLEWICKHRLPDRKREFFSDHYHIIETLLTRSNGACTAT